jgi:formylglycine-generating enzyme required for sulfatase activity
MGETVIFGATFMKTMKSVGIVLLAAVVLAAIGGCKSKGSAEQNKPDAGPASKPGLVENVGTPTSTLPVPPSDTAPASLPATTSDTSPAKQITLDLGNKVTMKLVLIPAGKFTMGSPKGEKDRSGDEDPQHEVTISKPYYMSSYEITQEQWMAVMGTTPWKDRELAKSGATHPASNINWIDATDFCKKLSAQTGKPVSLPTEAQWEYACRAGSKTRLCYGDDNDNSKLGNYAWYKKNAWGVGERYAHPVGQKKANDFGLYDMHGNVWEWCADWYADSYADAKNIDPKGPASGKFRILRGGCWGDDQLRSARRFWYYPDLAENYNGFRVIVDASATAQATQPAATQSSTSPASHPSSHGRAT